MTEAQLQAAIAKLMAKGKERTVGEIASRMPVAENRTREVLKKMARMGLLEHSEVHDGKVIIGTYRKHPSLMEAGKC